MKILKMASKLDVISFLAVSRVAKRKGHMSDMQIDMAKKVVEEGMPGDLLQKLVGDGAINDQIAKQKEVFDLENAAVLLASVDGDERVTQLAGLTEEIYRLRQSILADKLEEAKEVQSEVAAKADSVVRAIEAVSAN